MRASARVGVVEVEERRDDGDDVKREERRCRCGGGPRPEEGIGMGLQWHRLAPLLAASNATRRVVDVVRTLGSTLPGVPAPHHSIAQRVVAVAGRAFPCLSSFLRPSLKGGRFGHLAR